MTEIKNVLIVGLGAIGTIYAAKLKAYNPGGVRVLVDESRLERYRAQGIVFNGIRQDFNYVLPGPNAQKADLILIATKVDGLAAAIDAIAGFVGEDTLILSLLNGITSEDDIAARYGWEHVLHAYFTGHASIRVGNAITFDGVGRIVFGDVSSPPHSPRVERVARFFDKAGIDYERPDDIRFSQWGKFVVNVGINQASAVLHASYGDFQNSPSAHAVLVALMTEAVQVARPAGIGNADALLPWAIEFIDKMPPALKSSMLQDIEAGKKTEVAMFGGVVCALGEKYGIPTPHNALFLQLIHALEEITGGY